MVITKSFRRFQQQNDQHIRSLHGGTTHAVRKLGHSSIASAVKFSRKTERNAFELYRRERAHRKHRR